MWLEWTILILIIISFNPPPPPQLFSLVLLCEELEQKALALLTGDREVRALLLAQKDDLCSLVFSLLKLKHLQLLSSKYATGIQQVHYREVPFFGGY